MTDPVRRIYAIAEEGCFCKSSSASTVELHLEMRKVMGSLAPCQLPEFLSHDNKWVRYYANERRASVASIGRAADP